MSSNRPSDESIKIKDSIHTHVCAPIYMPIHVRNNDLNSSVGDPRESRNGMNSNTIINLYWPNKYRHQSPSQSKSQ